MVGRIQMYELKAILIGPERPVVNVIGILT
jgi:hypothetical protein